MKRSLSIIAVWSILLLTAGTAMAQNGTPAADPSDEFEFSGTVLSFTAGSRSGMPLLTVEADGNGTVHVALGPAWYLQEAGFSVSVGDYVRVVAFPCSTCAAENVAKRVDNDDNGSWVELRGDDGVPRGSGGYQGNSGNDDPGSDGNGNGDSGQGDSGQGGTGMQTRGENSQGVRTGRTWGLDMTTVTDVSGVVVSFMEQPAQGESHLKLEVDDTVLRILVTPFKKVEAAGIILNAGDPLSVTYAMTKCSEPEMCALSLTDEETGLTVQLRDPETGFPISGSRHGWSDD